MYVFLVEDGTGITNATSYVTVQEYRDYFSIRPEATVVATLTDTQIENLLMRATILVELFFQFEGIEATTTQSLLWPRQLVTNTCTGKSIPSNIIPIELKNTVIEIADYIRRKDTATQSSEYLDTIQSNEIAELELDVLRVRFNDRKKLNTGAINGPKLAGLPVSILKFMRCISKFTDARWATRRVKVIHSDLKT